MQKILEQYNKQTVGRNCLWASIESVLNYMGAHYMEHEIYFVCYGMDIKFVSDGILGHKNITQMLANSNLSKIVDIRSHSCPLLLSEIYNTLFKNAPIICVLQAKNMKYHKEYSQITHSRRHTVVLYGINAHTGQAYISDRYFIDILGKYHVFYEAIKIDDFIPYLTEAFHFSLKTEVHIKFDFKYLLNSAIENYNSPKVETGIVQGNAAWVSYFDYVLSTYFEDKKLFYNKSMEISFLIKNVLIVPSLEYIICLLEQNLTECSKTKVCILELKHLIDDWNLFSSDVIRKCLRGNEDSCLALSDINKEIVKRQIAILKSTKESLYE